MIDVTVAVTGGAGLIGSFLVDELVAAGATVVVIDDFSKGLRENLAHHGARVEVREADLEEPAASLDALAGAEVVFHLASRAYGVGYAAGHHIEILRHNERITDNLLAAVDRHRPRYLLVTSSSCVYDDGGPDVLPELALFDGEPEQINWGYGWAKRFLEQKALLHARESGVATTIVRPFNIYGERYRWVGAYSQAIPMLVKKVLGGDDPVVIWGSGDQRRNYMHAADCARAMRGVVEAGHTAGPVNIGGEDTVSMRELVGLICEVAGRSPGLVCDAAKPEGRFVKSCDASALRAAVPGFAPTISLRDGVTRMIEWYGRTFAGGG